VDERVDVSKPPSWKFIRRKNPREIGGFFLPKIGWRMDGKERKLFKRKWEVDNELSELLKKYANKRPDLLEIYKGEEKILREGG